MALNKEPAKIFDEIFKNNEMTDFKYENPGFSVSYPKNWTQIPLLLNIPVKILAVTVENSLSVIVLDMIPNMELKNVINLNTMFLSDVGSDVKTLSNVETKLKDNKTIAYECLIEYKRNGLFKSKTSTLSVFKENKIISVTVGYLPHNYDENLKKTLYSLTF